MTTNETFDICAFNLLKLFIQPQRNLINCTIKKNIVMRRKIRALVLEFRASFVGIWMWHRVIVSLNLRRRSNVIQRWPLHQSSGFHVQSTMALCWETTMDLMQGPYEWPCYKRKVMARPDGVHFVAGPLCSVVYVGLGGVGHWHCKHVTFTWKIPSIWVNDKWPPQHLKVQHWTISTQVRWQEPLAYLLNIILKKKKKKKKSHRRGGQGKSSFH